MLLHFCRKKVISHPASLYAFLLPSSLAHVRGSSGTWHKNTLHWYRSSWGKSISAFPHTNERPPPRSKIWRNLQKAGCDGVTQVLTFGLDTWTQSVKHLTWQNFWQYQISNCCQWNTRLPLLATLCQEDLFGSSYSQKSESFHDRNTCGTRLRTHSSVVSTSILPSYPLQEPLVTSKLYSLSKMWVDSSKHNSNLSSQKLHLH